MGDVAGLITLVVRVLDDIIEHEAWYLILDADELKGLAQWQENAIDALALKELVRVAKGLSWGIPGRDQHVMLALELTASAVFSAWVRAVTTVALGDAWVAEDVVEVLLDRDWAATFYELSPPILTPKLAYANFDEQLGG